LLELLARLEPELVGQQSSSSWDWDGDGDPRRRDDRPHGARAGRDATPRPGELVDPALARSSSSPTGRRRRARVGRGRTGLRSIWLRWPASAGHLAVSLI